MAQGIFGKKAGVDIVPVIGYSNRTQEITNTQLGITQVGATVTSFTVTAAKAIYEEDSNGNGRIRGTTHLTFDSVTTPTYLTITFAGAAFTAGLGSVNAQEGSGGRIYSDCVVSNTTDIKVYMQNAAGGVGFDNCDLSFDIPLTARPSWAAAKFEGAHDVVAYFPEASTTQTGLVNTQAQGFEGEKRLEKSLGLKQVATPSTPSSGYHKIYPKSDGKFYSLNSAGEEKVIGGGLIPVLWDDSYAVGGGNASTMVSGYHYLIDMSAALTNKTFEVAQLAAESVIKATVFGNATNGYLAEFDAYDTEIFYYDGSTDTSVQLVNVETWIQFTADGTTQWVVEDASTPVLGDFSGDLNITGDLKVDGVVSISKNSNHAWGATYKGLQLGPNGNAMYSVNLGVNSYLGLLGNCYHDGAAYKYISADEASMYNQYAGKHSFYTTAAGSAGDTIGWTLGLVMSNTGKVGIGISAPTVPLHVYSDAEGAIGSFSIDGSGAIEISQRAATSGRDRGYFLMQNTSTSTALWFGNDAKFRYGGTSSIAIDGTADSGSVVGDQTSDIRTKENIAPINYGLNDILNLNPVQFDQFGKHTLGFIAQETRLVIPEAVYDTKEDLFNDPENTLLNMSYILLMPVLVKSIQEQQAIIDSLKARIEALENR